MNHLSGLNERQKEAAEHLKGPLLIIAGAGAGKTKTITHRIAHLIEGGAAPHSILAVTFTNKAAAEMRSRALALLGLEPNLSPFSSRSPRMTTFHSLGVQILRDHAGTSDIPQSFNIWDRDDSTRLVKRILAERGLERFTPRAVLGRISREKGRAQTVAGFAESAHSFETEEIAEVWRRYEEGLRAEGAFDFDDLLLRTLLLIRDNAEVREKLRERWQHLTIDEYQDTNRVQYEIARILAGERMNICAVGDMDQCLVGGTKITMADGSQRPIERVREGDEVLSNFGSGDMRPAKVTRFVKKTHKGDLIRIMTRSGLSLTSTPEHMHFAGYRLGIAPQSYFTYLIHKRGVGWRLGVSQTYTKGQKRPMIGFQQRCNHEHADAVWVVGVHESMQAARVAEYTLSLNYRIPTLPFVARKGLSQNGYVHDQSALNAIFAEFDTENGALQLLNDRHLSVRHPHHRAQATTGGRRNIVVTLCGDRRGKTPMHRISFSSSDAEGRDLLIKAGFSVRTTTRNPRSWRFEACNKDYKKILTTVAALKRLFPDAHIVETARLGGKKPSAKHGSALPFMPADSILPGMALFNAKGTYDIVERVDRIQARHTVVYDLDIEHTHNFVANGIATHNCIYSWRGADINHLFAFEKNFPNAKVVLLEENYRSTQTILSAANAVIAKNTRRFEKRLFTGNPTGEAITLYAGASDREEAMFVARTARELLGSGVPASEIAVLFRENFQSRALEEAFIWAGIPYRVLGVRFFDRAEVKDVLAYVRVALNPRAFTDFARAAGTPARGIGKQTLEKIARGEDATLSGAARAKVDGFRGLLGKIRTALLGKTASEALRYVVLESGIERLLAEGDDEARERLTNIFELISHAMRYDELPAPQGIEKLLEDAALMGEQDALQDSRERPVSLMTIHAAKGLEFDAVFVTGLEQGLFPSERANDAERDDEEERRLFYVALTRAKKYLYLTLAGARVKYGSREHTIPSSFLHDIDERLITYADTRAFEPTIEL